MSILSFEGKALGEWLWSYTVGITNRAFVMTGTDPNWPASEETLGTGFAPALDSKPLLEEFVPCLLP
jgi:hypothetical protein